MHFRRFLAFLLCIAMLSVGCVAMASELDETVSIEYVPISGETCVVDSLYGVDAIYSTTTSYYQCWEYVQRFYETVYGITIGNDGFAPTTGGTSCWFESTTTPKPGDITYATAARRGSYGHWAIVKSYDEEAGTITLIEQNFDWNGCAGIEREITFPSSYYEVYTLCNADGAVAPVIDITQFEIEEEAEVQEVTVSAEAASQLSSDILPTD